MANDETSDASVAVAEALTNPSLAGAKHKANERVPKGASTKRRRFSDRERAEKLAAIEAEIAEGKTLKSSVKNAGITEQSYYQWKKAAKAPEKPAGPASDDIALAELIELEAENQRLRTQLATKLRAENEELRKRLRET